MVAAFTIRQRDNAGHRTKGKNRNLIRTDAVGVDKRDIRTVINRDLRPTVESHLQESGPAVAGTGERIPTDLQAASRRTTL